MKFIVGKPSYKSAIIYSIITILFGLLLISRGVLPLLDIIGYLLFTTTFLIVLPGISYDRLLWKVEENTLSFTEYPHCYEKTIWFYKRLFGITKTLYQNVVYLDHIDYIHITWENVPMFFFGLVGHPIIFKIHTRDGSVIKMNSLTVSDTTAYIKAVHYMKSIGIRFVDKHNLLEAIENPNIQVSEYIDEIERRAS